MKGSAMGKHRKWVQILILSAVVIVGCVTIGGSLLSQKNGFPKVGDTVPDFALRDLDGKVRQVSDYRGKAVMINFWGTFCPPCKEEMPAIQRQYEKWNGSGLEVLAVNLDEPYVTVKSFVSRIGVTFPVLFDENKTIARQFGVTSYPTTFFVDGNGKIKDIFVGGMKESDIEARLAGILPERR